MVIGGLMRLVGKRDDSAKPQAAGASAPSAPPNSTTFFCKSCCQRVAFHVLAISTLGRIALTSAIATCWAATAFADFKVHLPDAETGEFELEEVGSYGNSGNPLTSNEKSFVHELGYGVNDWWHTEVEFETGRDPGPGNHLKLNQLTSENQFVFTEPGQYWLDSGFFWEYGQGMIQGQSERDHVWPDATEGDFRHHRTR